MKVLIVNSYYYPDIIGGAERSTQLLAEGLARRGVNVCVLCNGLEDCKSEHNGVVIIRRRFNNIVSLCNYSDKKLITRLFFKILDYFNYFNYGPIRKVLLSEKPDIIHTNNLYGISPVMWKAASGLRIPVVHTARDYYLLCPKIKYINNRNLECDKARAACKLYRLMYRRISKRVSCLVTPTGHTLDIFEKSSFFSGAKHRVINNACDCDIDDVRKTIKVKKESIASHDTITYIFAGGLYEHKGIGWLLKAFKNCKNQNVRLTIAGKGRMDRYVKEATAIDSRISFKGFLNAEELREEMKKSDVLIIPSIFAETFGRTIVEGYFAGLPAIGSNLGAIPEILINHKTGILVKPGNVDELSEVLDNLEKNRKLIFDMLGNIAIEAEKYTMDSHVNNYLDCYKNVLSNRL